MFQMLKEKNLGYDSFLVSIKELMEERMGESYDVRIQKVTKNNSLELYSLVILKGENSIAPNIYLEPYYKSYLEGISMSELADRIYRIYNEYKVPVFNETFVISFDRVKDFIFYRVVNYERNKPLLESIPHIKFLDLAIIFHYLVQKNSQGIGTIRISNEHLELWEADLNEINRIAQMNTERLFPYCIRRLEDVIGGLVFGEDGKDPGTLTEEGFEPKAELESGKEEMYILTNRTGINGASCILYNNVLMNFAARLQRDLYILPSSIHEVILLPYDKSFTREDLTAMVWDINHSQVAPEEVLSDEVYRYSLQEKRIIL